LQEPSYPVEEYIHTSPANILKKNLIPEFPNTPKNSRSNNVQNTMSFFTKAKIIQSQLSQSQLWCQQHQRWPSNTVWQPRIQKINDELIPVPDISDS
jgi:hypothetical protein